MECVIFLNDTISCVLGMNYCFLCHGYLTETMLTTAQEQRRDLQSEDAERHYAMAWEPGRGEVSAEMLW